MEVASPEGFKRNPELVLHFYNERRKQARTVLPNDGHLALADLETDFEVQIITQNVDNLHEKAGSSAVLHLHGELFKARSTGYPYLVYDLETDEIHPGDLCEKGTQLRPHIVWFGEDVPLFEKAAEIASTAEIMLIVGTSLVVYPANTLLQYTRKDCPIYLVDPIKPVEDFGRKIEYLLEPATTGIPKISKTLRETYL